MMNNQRMLKISIFLALPLPRYYRTDDTPHERG